MSKLYSNIQTESRHNPRVASYLIGLNIRVSFPWSSPLWGFKKEWISSVTQPIFKEVASPIALSITWGCSWIQFSSTLLTIHEDSYFNFLGHLLVLIFCKAISYISAISIIKMSSCLELRLNSRKRCSIFIQLDLSSGRCAWSMVGWFLLYLRFSILVTRFSLLGGRERQLVYAVTYFNMASLPTDVGLLSRCNIRAA